MNKFSICIGLLLACLFFTCKPKESDYHSLREKFEVEGENYEGINIDSESFLGNETLIEISEGGHSFLIPQRKGQITSYSCTECHSKPLAEMVSEEDLKKAHWDIELIHADEEIMNCASCHNPNNMDNLNGLLGKNIDFDHSYKLCAQCHTSQFEGWKGGAHGKNIGGWAPPRASMTCVNCHNPHQPQIASKWPDRFNTRKVEERR